METRTIILTKQKKYTEILSETLQAVLLLTGICLSLQDLFDSSLCMAAAMAAGILFLVTVQTAALWTKQAQRVKQFWYLLETAAFLLGTSWISQGFLTAVNQFLYLWNGRFGTEMGFFSLNGRAPAGAVLMWALLAAGIAALLLGQIRKKRLGGLVTVSALAFAFGCICGQSSMWVPVVLFGIAGLWKFSYDTGAISRVKTGGILLMAILLVAAAGICAVSVGVGKSVRLENWKQDWKDAVEAFRYGEDTLPRGNLQKAGQLLEGDAERLLVEMQQPVELYLRGFVGDQYQWNHWQSLSYLNYQDEYAGMLKWLRTEGLMPVSQYSAYQTVTAESLGTVTDTSEVKVENTGAFRKYVYLPATVSRWDSSGSSVRKDHNVQSNAFFGAGSYTFTMIADEQTADKVTYADWISQPASDTETAYLDTESVYHSFTDTFYKKVDPQMEEQIQNLFFPEGTEMSDFQEVTTQIRKVLRMDMQYREQPDVAARGTDLLTEFLEGRADGNAAAFASAAVMAYRVAGYPARYVEGYHLSETQAAELAQNGETTAVLTTKNAHAWAEVYMTGAGWMPVEVVPGMYTETYTTEKVEGRPAYQVNSVSEDHGVDNSQDTKEKSGGSGSETQNRESVRLTHWLPEKLILAAYILFVIYLLLELQRVVRIRVQGSRRKKEEEVENWNLQIRRILTIGKVKGDYAKPLELLEQIQEKFPGIREEEYDRIVELIQKARFGGKQWTLAEQRCMEYFVRHLKESLYENSSRAKRLMLRYLWLISQQKIKKI